MLNFEPGRHVRGVFASFSGADFSRGVKTLIFDLLGGSGAVFGAPGGTPGRSKIKECSVLSLEGMLGVVLHSFSALISKQALQICD